MEYLDETLAEKEGRPDTFPDVPDAASVSEFVLWWLVEGVSDGGGPPKEDRVLVGGSPGDSRFDTDDG